MYQVFHPTDFTRDSERAFHHALKLVFQARGMLNIMHVDPPRSEKTWDQFPRVRGTLARWGHLPLGAARRDLEKLHIGVRKTIATQQDPNKAMAHFLEKHHADLVVMATGQRRGLAKFSRPSIAGRLARDSRLQTLFVPGGGGFVERETGVSRLRHLLIPVDRQPAAGPAIEAAAWLARLLGHEDTRFSLLHVDETEPVFPELALPAEGRWERVTRVGSVLETVLDYVARESVDCIVMTTSGRRGLLESLTGSMAERVVAQAPCPVLTLPD